MVNMDTNQRSIEKGPPSRKNPLDHIETLKENEEISKRKISFDICRDWSNSGIKI